MTTEDYDSIPFGSTDGEREREEFMKSKEYSIQQKMNWIKFNINRVEEYGDYRQYIPTEIQADSKFRTDCIQLNPASIDLFKQPTKDEKNALLP